MFEDKGQWDYSVWGSEKAFGKMLVVCLRGISTEEGRKLLRFCEPFNRSRHFAVGIILKPVTNWKKPFC